MAAREQDGRSAHKLLPFHAQGFGCVTHVSEHLLPMSPEQTTSPGHDERREWCPRDFQARRISYLRFQALRQL